MMGKPTRREFFILVVGSVIIIGLCFLLLPMTWAAIVAGAGSTIYALVMAEHFDKLDEKHATIRKTLEH